MPSEFVLLLALPGVMALAAVAAARLKVPASIVLVLFGLALAFAPGLPRIDLAPDLVLLGLLPPLLYSSGVGMSWKGFKANVRPILIMAVGCVLFTAAAVAALAHYAFGLAWAVGFVLGAVVSPPDSVAPMSIARRLLIPKRILIILEGESLCNDATALIVFGFALTAVLTGQWSMASAIGSFLAIAVGETVWGALIAWVALHLRRMARDPQVEVVIALLTPFAAFWPPHFAGGSGVLAAVAAGLFVSWNGTRFIAPATRLQGFFVWDLVVFVITGALFLLTGLQARSLLEGAGAQNWSRLLGACALVTLVVVAVRFLWVFAATYGPDLLRVRIAARDSLPHWSYPLVIAFTGIRGVVSLAAAFSVPAIVGNQPFPGREIILLSTYCVILFTLVGQGLTLPWIIRKAGLSKAGRREAIEDQRAENKARLSGVDAVLERLDDMPQSSARPDLVTAVRNRHLYRRAHLAAFGEQDTPGNPVADEALLQLELVKAERKVNAKNYRDGLIDDAARRRIERELDLEEARARLAAEGF
jgi:monovalent cation/hydrogen antiporter